MDRIDINKLKSNLESFPIFNVLMKLEDDKRYEMGVPFLIIYTNLASITDAFKDESKLRQVLLLLSMKGYVIIDVNQLYTAGPKLIKSYPALKEAFDVFNRM
jgi:hypothetical protein